VPERDDHEFVHADHLHLGVLIEKATQVQTISRQHGFTLVELMISMTVTLIAVAAALTTFSQGLIMNDTGSQLSDANQNLRAGGNQLLQDLKQAGRVIGPSGIPVPTGAGVTAFNRPGPLGTVPYPLTFSLVLDPSNPSNLPSISTGYAMGPNVIGELTDVITIMTVDEFMPSIQTPPVVPAAPSAIEGTIAPNGQSVTLPATSQWLLGDPANLTPAMQVGDLVLFSNPNGMAIHTITSTDATHIYFGISPNANDWFNFNQFNAPMVPLMLIKLPLNTTSAWTQQTTMFRVVMITYYVDCIPLGCAAGGTPLLVKVLNNGTPQALSGVVEDLNFTYDLVDGVLNPTSVNSLPCPTAIELICGSVTPPAGVTYNSNQIRKVNVHMGVRSEYMSRPLHDYLRNHVNTAVDIRNLASVDRYVTN
jgi:prepilin-type N-terminal cleavage/methylation domain-containing protein